LSRVTNAKEWADLYDESERQAVTGIMVAGLERLPKEQRPRQELLLQWIGISEQIRQRNISLNSRSKQLQRKLKEFGYESSILKGQGVALYYDEPLRELRQTGDIDIFVDCGLKGAISVARQLGVENPEWDYKHLHLDVFEDAEVEMHYRVEVLLNLWKNRKLQRWFREHPDDIFGTFKDSENPQMVTPTVEFNVFYILLHIYRHFLYEGVGLRQIMDYYFVLKVFSNTDDKTLADSYAVKAVEEFGMSKFAKGIMWVMNECFGMPERWMIWDVDEKEGRYILEQVMTGGNFGNYDERINKGKGKIGTVSAVIAHNAHLITHYPADTIWAPIWIVWHKIWKICNKAIFKI
jgi:hypothetical protein